MCLFCCGWFYLEVWTYLVCDDMRAVVTSRVQTTLYMRCENRGVRIKSRGRNSKGWSLHLEVLCVMDSVCLPGGWVMTTTTLTAFSLGF